MLVNCEPKERVIYVFTSKTVRKLQSAKDTEKQNRPSIMLENLEWEGLCIMYHHFEMSKKTRPVINKDMEEQKDHYHVGEIWSGKDCVSCIITLK